MPVLFVAAAVSPDQLCENGGGDFKTSGEAGLVELSRRPHHSPNRKVLDTEIAGVSDLRKRRLGSRRIQSELLRNYAFSISRATLCKILRQLNAGCS